MTHPEPPIEILGEEAARTIGLVLSMANLEAIDAASSTGNLRDFHTMFAAMREQALLQKQSGLLAKVQKAFDDFSATNL